MFVNAEQSQHITHTHSHKTMRSHCKPQAHTVPPMQWCRRPHNNLCRRYGRILRTVCACNGASLRPARHLYRQKTTIFQDAPFFFHQMSRREVSMRSQAVQHAAQQAQCRQTLAKRPRSKNNRLHENELDSGDRAARSTVTFASSV